MQLDFFFYDIISLISQPFCWLFLNVCNIFYIFYNGCDKNKCVVQIESSEKEKEKPIILKFEDKYLDKFKRMSNEFYFNEDELKDIEIEFNILKSKFKSEKDENVIELTNKINEINKIINMFKKDDLEIKPIIGELLLKYFDLDDDDDDLSENWIDDLYSKICLEKDKMTFDIEKIKNEIENMNDETFKSSAKENITNKKLDKFINNYVSEYTPLGNIFMRYNNNKKSFEYFSNNTIPYRYLEPVARKYAITYWCKPLVFDIDEQLKQVDLKTINQNVKRTHDFTKQPMKNRNNSESTFPVNNLLVDKTKNNNDKIMLKENANRYTWEGRIVDFQPIQKINKKIFNKKLEMTYAEFKRLKNKK